MSSIEKKKSSIKNKKKPSNLEKITEFLKFLGVTLIILAIYFIISPPLFYTSRFINNYILKQKIRYNGYDTYETYFNKEVEFPEAKRGVPTLPMNQRPLMENVTQAFKASLANSFFMSRDITNSILGFSKKLLDFNTNFDENLFKEGANVNDILRVMGNINNEDKPTGLIGQIIGAVIIILSPLIYLLLLGLPALSFLSGLFTLFTTLNMRTYIKSLTILGVIIGAYLSSYILLFIPSIFFLFIPQIAIGWVMFIIGIILASLIIGIPSLVMIISSLITSLKVVGSVLWLPELVNKIFMGKMNTQDLKNRYQGVKLQGTRQQYPAHARGFSGVYLTLFLMFALYGGAKVIF